MINNVLNYLKSNHVKVPISLGLMINKIPFNLRPGIGKMYASQKNNIKTFTSKSEKERKEFIFQNFNKMFQHAYHNTKFYRRLYDSHSINPSKIKTYDDIQRIPIINKDVLLDWDIEDRSYSLENRILVNTGGSSGKGLAFYMDPLRYGNEWAHIHDMWSKLDYTPDSLKLIFDGRVKESDKLEYDFVRNSLLYNIYSNPNSFKNQLLTLSKEFKIEYLHGYPSAIFEFALFCEKNLTLKSQLKKTLKGAFLSSEYPSPHYRDKIEETFDIETQSFYGHTETCVLAVETNKFQFEPYHTYGYAESQFINGAECLIGTSYFNFASPLIRYNTEDLIEPKVENGLLRSFKIKEGRVGEYILDQNGKKIPLTGLIYGRHHKLFDVSEHVQVYQDKAGYAKILYVSKENMVLSNAAKYFNSDNVHIKFEFIPKDKPILSKSGKINLLVKQLDD